MQVQDQCQMRRFVRHKGTGTYLNQDGRWIDKPSGALHFESIQTVLTVQRQLNLREIEIVLQLGPEPSEEYDIAVPLRDPLT